MSARESLLFGVVSIAGLLPREGVLLWVLLGRLAEGISGQEVVSNLVNDISNFLRRRLSSFCIMTFFTISVLILPMAFLFEAWLLK